MIIDTNRRTTANLDCFLGAGVSTIVRYYARTTQQAEKRLTRAEAQAMTATGLTIVAVHQAAGDGATSFSTQRGRLDAEYALKYAIETIGQPGGTAIYFAVDFDCNATQFQNNIVPYFQAVHDVFGSANVSKGYVIGAYGNGLVLGGLLAGNLCKYAWLSQSMGHHGSKAFKQSGQWSLAQRLPSTLCGIGVDVDELNPAVVGFGDFARLDLLQTVLTATGAQAAASRRFRTTAASGLRLRAGPGTEFDVVRSLPAGTIVGVLSHFGDWAIVDVHGNDEADGAVHASFLAPAP